MRTITGFELGVNTCTNTTLAKLKYLDEIVTIDGTVMVVVQFGETWDRQPIPYALTKIKQQLNDTSKGCHSYYNSLSTTRRRLTIADVS